MSSLWHCRDILYASATFYLLLGIKIKFEGEERNDWSETESYYDDIEKKDKTRTVYYSGRNTFLYAENSLHGGGKSKDVINAMIFNIA